LTFLNIHIYFIMLKTYDQQFTLTTKKSLHIIFKGNEVYIVQASQHYSAAKSAKRQITHQVTHQLHLQPLARPI